MCALAAALLAGLLTGCVNAPLPVPSPTETPDAAAPLFATDEEALAAAEAAYAAYLAASDEILASGGVKPERLVPFVSPAFFEHEMEGFERAREEGLRYVGETAFSRFELQAHNPNPGPGSTVVSAYVCVNYAGVDVVDAGGLSRTAPNRPADLAFVVGFIAGSTADELILATKEPWAGTGVC
ncbi:hypothetical protein [Microterricola viridarii]|uniref:hypothetical protein n=1 Tax=Microterricola viridarii TaxID=412690 RepID=UPI00101AEC96|nr:hypothetical protein [Microterricola viridarii]